MDQNKKNLDNQTYLFCCDNKNLSVHREHNVYEDETDYKYEYWF